MAALLRRREPRARTIEFTFGRSSLADVATEVMNMLRDPEATVTVRITGFDYFDENDIAAVADLASWSRRVRVVGLDTYADQILPPPPSVPLDVRTPAEAAVTHLTEVTVVTAIGHGLRLDDSEFDRALQLAMNGGRAIVTIDLRHIDRLSPAQVLALVENSTELYLAGRTLIVVNAGHLVAEQLRQAGLIGGLRMSVDDLL